MLQRWQGSLESRAIHRVRPAHSQLPLEPPNLPVRLSGSSHVFSLVLPEWERCNKDATTLYCLADHSGIHAQVYRIQNKRLWSRYVDRRLEVAEAVDRAAAQSSKGARRRWSLPGASVPAAVSTGLAPPCPRQTRGCLPPRVVWRARRLAVAPFLPFHCCHELFLCAPQPEDLIARAASEHLLFHGADLSAIANIVKARAASAPLPPRRPRCLRREAAASPLPPAPRSRTTPPQGGFECRIASMGGALGAGAYFAERAQYSDAFSRTPQSRAQWAAPPTHHGYGYPGGHGQKQGGHGHHLQQATQEFRAAIDVPHGAHERALLGAAHSRGISEGQPLTRLPAPLRGRRAGHLVMICARVALGKVGSPTPGGCAPARPSAPRGQPPPRPLAPSATRAGAPADYSPAHTHTSPHSAPSSAAHAATAGASPPPGSRVSARRRPARSTPCLTTSRRIRSG